MAIKRAEFEMEYPLPHNIMWSGYHNHYMARSPSVRVSTLDTYRMLWRCWQKGWNARKTAELYTNLNNTESNFATTIIQDPKVKKLEEGVKYVIQELEKDNAKFEEWARGYLERLLNENS